MSVLEDTARLTENRAPPTSAAVAAVQMAIEQGRKFQDTLKESAERRRQEAAEAERQAADERSRAQSAERPVGTQDGDVDAGTQDAGSQGSAPDGQGVSNGPSDRGTAVNIEV